MGAKFTSNQNLIFSYDVFGILFCFLSVFGVSKTSKKPEHLGSGKIQKIEKNAR